MGDRDLKALGYICATILGGLLLVVDGTAAVAYCIAVGTTMVGIQMLKPVFQDDGTKET